MEIVAKRLSKLRVSDLARLAIFMLAAVEVYVVTLRV